MNPIQDATTSSLPTQTDAANRLRADDELQARRRGDMKAMVRRFTGLLRDPMMPGFNDAWVEMLARVSDAPDDAEPCALDVGKILILTPRDFLFALLSFALAEGYLQGRADKLLPAELFLMIAKGLPMEWAQADFIPEVFMQWRSSQQEPSGSQAEPSCPGTACPG